MGEAHMGKPNRINLSNPNIGAVHKIMKSLGI